jgi:hypothetical protein
VTFTGVAGFRDPDKAHCSFLPVIREFHVQCMDDCALSIAVSLEVVLHKGFG